MTGSCPGRNLRWDRQYTIEEPHEIKIGDSGEIALDLALLSDGEDCAVYGHKIT
jgi:hypothetical protein